MSDDDVIDEAVGEILRDKYELLELAGEGGMARVYRAMTRGAKGFRRPVAIKRILGELSDDPEFLAMFVEEARVVSELHHPNIAQIHDFDEDADGDYFLVMEWVEGLNLLDWSLAHRRVNALTPWPLVSAIGIEVLKALTAAHERTSPNGDLHPIFHRDVTPQNILLTITGTVKLTDFGLARAMDRSRTTQPHMVKGKISYLAPELTEGADPSVQTDLWGVGVVLWETLMGEKLFKGENPLETVTAIRSGAVPSIKERRPDVPEELERVLFRALAQEPAHRFDNARSMVRALSNLLRTTPASTSAEILGGSVRDARAWLERDAESEAATRAEEVLRGESASVTMLDPEDDTPLLLTRRRPKSDRTELDD